MILSILDTDKQRTGRTEVIAYLSAAVFCFLFQLIYHHYSHGVKSDYMTFAFLIPLLGCVISVLGAMGVLPVLKTRQLLAGGVIWLTLGSIFEGVLEIYGTTNKLVLVFLFVGAGQLLLAMIGILFAYRKDCARE